MTLRTSKQQSFDVATQASLLIAKSTLRTESLRKVTLVERAAFCLLLLYTLTPNVWAEPVSESTVGLPAKLYDLILPGSPLEVRPIERDSKVVVRILQTIVFGTKGHRYEIEYFGLEAGEYNLADYLQRVDGTSTDDLPEVTVNIASKLGEGQVQPNALSSKTTPRIGGYRNWLWIGGAIWVLGLLALLFLGKKKQLTAAETEARRVSLAERMRPLVEQASRGDLPDEKLAELERMLLTYWRGKLDLNQANASDAMTTLRNHETAGELLRQLEGWLHMPADRRQSVDVGKLLEPYRNVRADA